jgi:hypothetical protein
MAQAFMAGDPELGAGRTRRWDDHPASKREAPLAGQPSGAPTTSNSPAACPSDSSATKTFIVRSDSASKELKCPT